MLMHLRLAMRFTIIMFVMGIWNVFMIVVLEMHVVMVERLLLGCFLIVMHMFLMLLVLIL